MDVSGGWCGMGRVPAARVGWCIMIACTGFRCDHVQSCSAGRQQRAQWVCKGCSNCCTFHHLVDHAQVILRASTEILWWWWWAFTTDHRLNTNCQPYCHTGRWHLIVFPYYLLLECLVFVGFGNSDNFIIVPDVGMRVCWWSSSWSSCDSCSRPCYIVWKGQEGDNKLRPGNGWELPDLGVMTKSVKLSYRLFFIFANN